MKFCTSKILKEKLVLFFKLIKKIEKKKNNFSDWLKNELNIEFAEYYFKVELDEDCCEKDACDEV